MRGDFSSWNKEKSLNFRGTLHQQGRVLLDRDWNAQTEIFNDWQETAARDTIGANVAAIPADAAESFRVTKAEITGGEVVVSVNRGRVWADGLLVEMNEENAPKTDFIAEYLAPPIQNPQAQTPNPPNSPVLRDAVILETWLEELNAFQLPEMLIEPALGGVDTTERMHAAFRFRLFRMNAGDPCASIAGALEDKFLNKGKLRATLQPPDTTIDGDCPVVEGGGYTGFEHQLYRVEIAESKQDGDWFKWSQFNGGLVGRGFFDAGKRKVDIKANRNAIINSGLTAFYLEALEFDEERNFWRVIYGAKVSLDSNNLLTLPDPLSDDVHTGAIPSPQTTSYFFRLWNGIERIKAFTNDETELQDGINLQFDPEAEGKYTPNDYWTFPVRAGEIENPQVLFESKPPEGIFYHRVPLAEINWRDDTLTEAEVEIEDCRQIFQPLTRLKGCCSYRVGDGIHSHGDFTSINAAIKALPETGGEICLLPGNFPENVILSAPRNKNISIKGCGSRSRIIAVGEGPAIHIAGGANLQIKSLAIDAGKEAVGILLEGDKIVSEEYKRAANVEEKFGRLREVEIEHLEINAASRSAIEMHVGKFVSIKNCRILIADAATDWAAVYLAGDDLIFEANEVRVAQVKASAVPPKTDDPEINLFASPDKAAKEKFSDTAEDPQSFSTAQNAPGGLHLSGGCERVRVINNLIVGGVGNGITLGSVDVKIDKEITVLHIPWTYYPQNKKRDLCKPKQGYIDITFINEKTRYVAGAPLRDILIEGNRIYAMGRNGIGVDAYFVIEEPEPNDPEKKAGGEFITVEDLYVFDNRIEFCVNLPLGKIPGRLISLIGFGGISLAVVFNLIVRDNFIENNGADYLEPVCGIFVFLGEGVEISRNRIVNNGRLTRESATGETRGARGGVTVFFALSPSGFDEMVKDSTGKLQNTPFLFPNGVPALKVHDNVIGVTMGRTLMTIAAGNVSVAGNQFLTRSVVPGFSFLKLLPSNVMIFNLGRSLSLKKSAGFGTITSEIGSNIDSDPDVFAHQQPQQPAPSGGSAPSQNIGTNEYSNQEMTDAMRTNLLSGNTLFSNNQCRTIAITGEKTFELYSILILSLADVGFHGNQCSLAAGRTNHLLQALVFGATVRFSDNYLEEANNAAPVSGITAGVLNTTTDNQSTHCLFGFGILRLARYNLSLLDALQPGDADDPNRQSKCGDSLSFLNKLLSKQK